MVSRELRSVLRDLIPELVLGQGCHRHMGLLCNGSGAMNIYSTINKVDRKEVHLLRLVVKCTVTDVQFTTDTSCSKWPPCALIHFKPCDQRTCTFKKNSCINASCSTENSLEYFSHVHLAYIQHSLHVAPHMVM